MKWARGFVMNAVIGGVLVVMPVYLTVLVLIHAMKSVVGLVRPLTLLIPDWMPAEDVLSLLIVVLFCFVVGLVVRTRAGRAVRERMEMSFFGRLPGYALFRSLTQQLAGEGQETVWRPALAEIEEALVPAFIIEELDDGRFTVFVPSVPTPLAGAVYVLARNRVHPLNVSFTQAVKSISRWGSGAKDLVASMSSEAPKYGAEPTARASRPS